MITPQIVDDIRTGCTLATEDIAVITKWEAQYATPTDFVNTVFNNLSNNMLANMAAVLAALGDG